MKDEQIGALAGTDGFDMVMMAQLTRVSLRGRSIEEAKEETGVSRSMYSKLLNQKLKSRPTVNTLRKLSIGNQPELLHKMLVACGYPQDIQEEVGTFLRVVKAAPALSGERRSRIPWSPSFALAMVLNSLMTRGYRSKADIEYHSDGLFAVDIGEAYPVLICIPLILPELEIRSNQVAKQALEAIAQCITRWGIEDTAIMLLTDSSVVYQMLKHLPNRSKVMAVAVVSEDGRSFERQCSILPKQPMKDSTGVFPVDLSTSGDELTSGD